MTLLRLQEIVVAALGAEDPAAALLAARDDPALTESERGWLAGANADGLRLTALLVVKLRFEAILRGDPELRRRFARDPERFSRAFERYVAAEPRRVIFPAEEAARFIAFTDSV